jgi:predicted transcriptional regulator
MSDLPKPTESELAILRALWKKHPATVREVMETLNEERDPPLAYTTVLKFFQIMTEKGLVTRDDADRTHSYSPAVPPDTTKKQMVGDLLDRLFQGSVSELVLQALGTSKLSKTEAAEIKKLLDQQTRGKP